MTFESAVMSPLSLALVMRSRAEAPGVENQMEADNLFRPVGDLESLESAVQWAAYTASGQLLPWQGSATPQGTLGDQEEATSELEAEALSSPEVPLTSAATSRSSTERAISGLRPETFFAVLMGAAGATALNRQMAPEE